MLGVCAALTLVISSNIARADIVFGPTGTEASLSNPDGSWGEAYGDGPGPSFDATTPPPSGDMAGSIYTQIAFAGGGQQMYVGVWTTSDPYWGSPKTIDGTAYASVEVDFKYDLTSTITPYTDAHVEIGLDTGYGGPTIETINTTTVDPQTSTLLFDGNWHHVSAPIPAEGGISAVAGPKFYTWNGTTTGTMKYWLANAQMISKPSVPPTMLSVTPAIPGLRLTVTPAAGAGGRQGIRTVASTGYSFAGQSSVTYSWDIKTWPDSSTDNNWQAHFMIVGPGDAGSANYNSAADWNMANAIYMTIQRAPDGTGFMSFRCKTNEPGGQNMLFNTYPQTDTVNNPNGYPVEPLGYLTCATPVGHWSVTIAGGNNVTVTPPASGTPATFALDAPTAAVFADPVCLILGCMANNAAGVGQNMVYGSFSVAGTPSSDFVDNFDADSVLNATLWENLSEDFAGVTLVPVGSAWWVAWSLPDSGFSLQTASSLPATELQWQDTTPLSTIIIGSPASKAASVPSSGNQAYYRLIKRVYSQLQVLLPGELAAPNTPTGKTGTPDVQATGVPFYVIVNAVDANFNPVPNTDTVQISDPLESNFISLSGTDATGTKQNLVNGTTTYQVEMLGDGSSQMTVTDLIDNTKSGVSSTVTY